MSPAEAERAAYDALVRCGIYVAPMTRQAYLAAMQILEAATAEHAAVENIQEMLDAMEEMEARHDLAAPARPAEE